MQVVAPLALGANTLQTGSFDKTNLSIVIAVLVLQVLLGLWVAVAWHRFVLLEERATTILPAFNRTLIVAYLIKTLLLLLVVLVVSFFVGGFFGFVSSATKNVWIALFAGSVITATGLWTTFRVSPMLPAAALGETMSLKDAWVSTKEHSGSLFILVILLVVATNAFNFLVSSVLAGSVVLLIVVGVVQTWFLLMLNISILTTIYGVAVEKRPL